MRQTQPQFSHVCLSSWREVPCMGLAFMIKAYSFRGCRRMQILSIGCQLSHVQLMPIFWRLAQQNSTSYSSLRGTKSHLTLSYYCLILSAGFLKVLYMRSFLLVENLSSCLYFLQSYELLIFVVYTLNQLAIVKKIWQKRGGFLLRGIILPGILTCLCT